MGRIHPHLKVKIVHSEGNTVPLNTAGELCTRGDSVMLRYWDEREQAAKVRDLEEWIHSGDLATLDGEGWRP